MQNKLIFCSNSLGQRLKGVCKNYYYLNNILDNKYKKYDVQCTGNLFRNFQVIYKVNEKVNGKRINIGGDHSIAIPTIAYSLNKNKNLKVIWIDAHADINTYQESKTKNYHGMPLAFLTGIDNNPKLNFINSLLKFENLLYIGIRDIDDFERNIIKSKNINVISMNDVKYDFSNCIDRINNFVGDDPVHLSFDMDSLDPSILKCTGTKVDDGLYLEESLEIIKVINQKKLVNTDITELNLDIGDIEDKLYSLNIFYNILKTLN